jgi:hypothetical protein
MIGSLLRHGIPAEIAIISDDAGPFNVFDHALCWIHTERLIHRLIPLNDQHKKAVECAGKNLGKLFFYFDEGCS